MSHPSTYDDQSTTPTGRPEGAPSYAGWGSRVGATLLDFLVIGLVPSLLIVAGNVLMVGTLAETADCPPGDLSCAPAEPQMPVGTLLLVGLGALAGLGLSLWQLHKEGTTGQTWGKKKVGISVLRASDGQPLGFGMAVVRRLVHVVDSLPCYLGWLWPLWDGRKQTFADKLVGSVVVRKDAGK